jgi:hypothetical protein
MRHPFVLAAVASLATLAVPSAAHALDWNFSFSFNNGDTASGTMTTGGTSAVAGQTYTISAISGTFKGQSITGLVTGSSSEIYNQFEWTGGSPSFKIANGIGWATSSFIAAISRGGSGFDYPGGWFISGVSQGNLTSYSISPPVSSSPAAAPGPLPLLGAGAAFSMSRRLRRRISRADRAGVAGSLPSRG